MSEDERPHQTAAPALDQAEAPCQQPPSDLQELDIYSIIAKVRTHDTEPTSTGVVKRYRKSGTASEAASSVETRVSPALPATSKVAPPKPCPFPAGTPRLGNPPARASDLASHAGAAPHFCSRPRFTVKYPSHKPGTPKPPPVFCKKHSSISSTPPSLGGKPCPDLRWERRSISQLKPALADSTDTPANFLSVTDAPQAKHCQPQRLCLPQARAPFMVTAASLAQSRRQRSHEQFRELVNRVGSSCELHVILSASKHPESHVQQLLASYAANTLYRYLACCFVFIDFMHVQHLSLSLVPVALMVDFLHASSASKQEDRAVHRTSPNTAIKALRWLAKHLQWQALSSCMHNALVGSYSKQVESYDKKEAVPLPLALVVAWEIALCLCSTPLTTKLVLGPALLCTHASIRFGDAQRVRWGSLQLSTQGLHAVAYATKTTKRGQPFACTWHGISGRDMHSSWLLHWLAALALSQISCFPTWTCKPLASNFWRLQATRARSSACDGRPRIKPCLGVPVLAPSKQAL